VTLLARSRSRVALLVRSRNGATLLAPVRQQGGPTGR
jgi:hypothetical protein